MKSETISLPAQAPEDLALIARWRGGDERAARLLVERHSVPLARFLANLGVRHEIDEMVQDTFVRAFASIDSLREGSSLRSWLFTIARNLVRDRARSLRRREIVELEEEHAVTSGDPLDGVVAGETMARLRQALERLTATQREVFQLRVGEGLSYREIARVVGSTEGASRVHYYNAMRAIKEFLDE
jgi:RNA polymerase sigma-70 factor (ECF subfamily)